MGNHKIYEIYSDQNDIKKRGEPFDFCNFANKMFN